ncbi:FIG00487748: hypothetical protein [hydrothermal vent metagenome]|uniref:Cytochrome c domain-containing protein n=1 Tax=hydrothermal vent metagenome TaxID=652676 RepID=A0A3B1AFE9_9ZZZZ
MFYKLVYFIFKLFKRYPKILPQTLLFSFVTVFLILAAGKTYQIWDTDPNRGAIAIKDGAFKDNYSTPVYLQQGWSESDSLWFYNTTQGSAFLPYDFLMVLQQAKSKERFLSNKNIDKFRYLPQKKTFFNPDALPVGFVKETYQGKDYIGFTCAACHTAQINYKGQAIRIDGGPSMADMAGFMAELEGALQAALNGKKQQTFIDDVLALDNDYNSKDKVISGLKKWLERRRLYNTINHSRVKYGYARLDAFGRIYNRVLQHVINKKQLATVLALTTESISTGSKRLLTDSEIDNVIEGINETIIGDDQFALIINRLQSKEAGYPSLSLKQMLTVRNAIFNEPNAPVSYPFLWDIAQSDYVQWNGIASNAGVGPIGRNTGEVIGVFAILDWKANAPDFSLSAWLSGQKNKKQHIDFKSSVDLTNLQRLEAHLRKLQSPQWPDMLGKIDKVKARKGQLIYAKRCQSCHELVDREDAERLVTAKMMGIKKAGTDPAMAVNSVSYTGKSGNLKHTYQGTDVGTVIIAETAPVAQILTSVTKGVVATPDADKWFIRRWADWAYTLAMSFTQNEIKASIKSGNYTADTTVNPYNSLLSYKARSLNGIWATAPYLHNGSVPTLYDLLLPVKKSGSPEDGEYRPNEFMVGSREFIPKKVGFKSTGYAGFKFTTLQAGNKNTGHEYGSPLNKQQRYELIEYLKTL